MNRFACELAFAAAVGLLVAAGGWAGEPAGPPGQCVITVGGKQIAPASHTVVIPERCTPQERHAARDLTNHIEKMTGKRLPVVAESQLGEKTPILVGRCTQTLDRPVQQDVREDRPEGGPDDGP